MKNTKEQKQYFIDSCGLLSIGIFSIAYSVWNATFAELNIAVSFLDFPIFVGEILLFICLILFAWRTKVTPLVWDTGGRIIVVFFIFILIKAFCGYHKWGSMAFRDAAMFYYLSFVVFGYFFFQKKFFFNERHVFLGALGVLLFLDRFYNSYWLLSFITFYLIYAFSFKSRSLRVGLCLLLLVITPFKLLLQTSRMMVLANIISILFLSFCFYFFKSTKKPLSTLAFAITLLVVFVSAVFFNKINAISTAFDFNVLKTMYVELDKKIEEGKDKYVEREIPLKLFRPNVPSFIREEINKSKPVGSDIVGSSQKELQSAKQEVKTSQKTSQPKEKDQTIKKKSQQAEQKQKLVMNDSKPNKIQVQKSNVEQPLNLKSSTIEISQPKRDASINDKVLSVSNQVDKIPSKEQQPAPSEKSNALTARDIDNALVTAIFRIFIWRDMWEDLKTHKHILGFNFGRPLRSKSLEILKWAESEWQYNGWIAAHNSYFDMVYRAGLVGILLVFSLFYFLFKMIKEFFRSKSVTGIFLCAIIINWFVAANFLLIFELPYTAIPIWTIYGMTFAYYQQVKKQRQKSLNVLEK